MSVIEIILVIVLLTLPIVTLFFFIKRKSKTKEHEEPIKQEEPKKEEIPNTKDKGIFPLNTYNYSVNDFKGYLKDKDEKISKPNKINHDKNFLNRSEPFAVKSDFRSYKKSLREEFDSLSPEMKAVILSGVLDKKKY